MIHRALLLASGLMLTTQLRADPCASENAAVNQLRQWVAYDLQFKPSTLAINEASLTKAIDLLGQCEHIDYRKAEPIVKDFANSLCITPPLVSDNTKVELSGDAKIKLEKFVTKIASIDVGGAAKYIDQKSTGLQSDLAKAIKDSNDCKVAVFMELYTKLTTHPLTSGPAGPAHLKKTISLRQGEVTPYFHGLNVKLTRVVSKHIYHYKDGTSLEEEGPWAEVSGELGGKAFKGEYEEGEVLTVSNPRCEFSMTFTEVIAVTDLSDPSSATVDIKGNCKE
jgi:hypothetical protein